CIFFFQAEDGIRDFHVTGVQTCALPIFASRDAPTAPPPSHSKGRLDAFTISAISSITVSGATGRVGCGRWMRSVERAGLRCTSTGISRLTGPVGAERAAETAAVSAPIAPLASHMRNTALE